MRRFVLRLLTALEEEREEEAARGGAGSPRRGAGGFPSGDSIGVDIIGVDIALGSPLASPMAQAAAAQAAAPPLGAINRSMTQPQLGRRRLSARVASMRY